jgi:hypothetical protein
MSITYDPEKWTNPLRVQEFRPPRRKAAELTLVSLRELRFFNETEGASKNPKAFAAFVREEEPDEPAGREFPNESTD